MEYLVPCLHNIKIWKRTDIIPFSHRMEKKKNENNLEIFYDLRESSFNMNL